MQVKINAIDTIDEKYFSNRIVLFRGTNKPPEDVFKNGFSIKDCGYEFKIENSSYLMKSQAEIANYVHTLSVIKQIPIVRDEKDQQIIPPGRNSGLISTTFSPFIATAYAAHAALTQISQHAFETSRRQQLAQVYREAIATNKQVLSYVYAVQLRSGLNIATNFLWRELPQDLFEQEIATVHIFPEDILCVRPIVVGTNSDNPFDDTFTLGNVVWNPNLKIDSLLGDDAFNAFLSMDSKLGSMRKNFLGLIFEPTFGKNDFMGTFAQQHINGKVPTRTDYFKKLFSSSHDNKATNNQPEEDAGRVNYMRPK